MKNIKNKFAIFIAALCVILFDGYLLSIAIDSVRMAYRYQETFQLSWLKTLSCGLLMLTCGGITKHKK